MKRIARNCSKPPRQSVLKAWGFWMGKTQCVLESGGARHYGLPGRRIAGAADSRVPWSRCLAERKAEWNTAGLVHAKRGASLAQVRHKLGHTVPVIAQRSGSAQRAWANASARLCCFIRRRAWMRCRTAKRATCIRDEEEPAPNWRSGCKWNSTISSAAGPLGVCGSASIRRRNCARPTAPQPARRCSKRSTRPRPRTAARRRDWLLGERRVSRHCARAQRRNARWTRTNPHRPGAYRGLPLVGRSGFAHGERGRGAGQHRARRKFDTHAATRPRSHGNQHPRGRQPRHSCCRL